MRHFERVGLSYLPRAELSSVLPKTEENCVQQRRLASAVGASDACNVWRCTASLTTGIFTHILPSVAHIKIQQRWCTADSAHHIYGQIRRYQYNTCERENLFGVTVHSSISYRTAVRTAAL